MVNWIPVIYWSAGSLFVCFLSAGIRVIRPIEKGLIETLGKYKKTAEQGFHWIIPMIQTMRKVNITERMVDIQPQTVITKDKLNAIVDAIVYYQIKDVKKSEYNVDNHRKQLSSLARTTLRAIMGKMTLTEANENRDDINQRIEKVLDKETDSYGVDVLRVEIQKIEPPQDVQVSMNQVVKAEQEKIAAINFANATETRADGERRAEIKKAEGVRQGRILEAEGTKQKSILEAEGKSKAFDLVNTAFVGNAQTLKKLEVTADSLKNNTKIVVPTDSELVNVIGNLSGVLPLKK